VLVWRQRCSFLTQRTFSTRTHTSSPHPNAPPHLQQHDLLQPRLVRHRDVGPPRAVLLVGEVQEGGGLEVAGRAGGHDVLELDAWGVGLGFRV